MCRTKDAQRKFMRAALLQAKGWEQQAQTAVGAVLVWRNRIARGHHRQAGGDHANRCLRKLNDPIPAEAVLYVTLRPARPVDELRPAQTISHPTRSSALVIGAVDRIRNIGAAHLIGLLGASWS